MAYRGMPTLEMVAAEVRPRPAKKHEGQDIVVNDAVLNARRR